MTIYTRYLNYGASGADDGTSESDGWESYTSVERDMTALTASLVAGDEVHIWAKQDAGAEADTSLWTYIEGPPVGAIIKLEGYKTTIGDGSTPGNEWVFGGCVRFVGDLILKNCKFLDTTGQVRSSAHLLEHVMAWNCQFISNYSSGGIAVEVQDSTLLDSYAKSNFRSASNADRKAIKVNRGAAIGCFADGGASIETGFRPGVFQNNIVIPGPWTTTGDALMVVDGVKDHAGVWIDHNTFYNATGDAIQFEEGGDLARSTYQVHCAHNIIWGAGGYAFRNAGSTYNPTWYNIFKNYYGNATSGLSSGLLGAGIWENTLLSGNPFTDAPNGDFSLNETAGAGAVIRAGALGDPFSVGTDVQRLAGAWQRGASSGGSASPTAY